MQNALLASAFALSATTISIAGYLAIAEKSGWGWFLFVGLLLGAAAIQKVSL
ncbi:hypothetical protein [Rhizobium metallidurans]|uniref:Uncharacterized protein n=1 Tax=Rhizobium metallidurans TaxID=1265931 RepID=A0A7W6CW78_9HYPH|nr:hypothetical protein [Rhizobium metallidurans]MBB3963516.1 hypothetical protein [Rhizobium metallidurans]